MNLKDILVHVDNRASCASRLQMASLLASRQQASLTGLYLLVHPYDVPEILATPVVAGSDVYMQWVRDEVARAAES